MAALKLPGTQAGAREHLGGLTRVVLNEALVQLPQLLSRDVPCGVIG